MSDVPSPPPDQPSSAPSPEESAPTSAPEPSAPAEPAAAPDSTPAAPASPPPAEGLSAAERLQLLQGLSVANVLSTVTRVLSDPADGPEDMLGKLGRQSALLVGLILIVATMVLHSTVRWVERSAMADRAAVVVEGATEGTTPAPAEPPAAASAGDRGFWRSLLFSLIFVPILVILLFALRRFVARVEGADIREDVFVLAYSGVPILVLSIPAIILGLIRTGVTHWLETFLVELGMIVGFLVLYNGLLDLGRLRARPAIFGLAIIVALAIAAAGWVAY